MPSTKFTYDVHDLADLVNPAKAGQPDTSIFTGIEDLCRGLSVEPTVGLCSDEAGEYSVGNTSSVKFADRKQAFGYAIQEPPPTLLKMTALMLLYHVLLAMGDRILSHVHLNGVGLNFVIGVLYFVLIPSSLFAAASLVTRVYGHLSKKLSSNKMHLFARVLRDGREQQLHVKKILVGDIQLVRPGDILAVDGIILKSDDLVCDEPTTTCCIKPKTKDPQCRYVIAGSKVLSGSGSVVVTAVGSEVHLVRRNSQGSLEPEQMWMSRTLFIFGLAGVVSGFLICAITWISMLPFTISRPYDVPEPYNEERRYDEDIVSILYQTMRVVSVVAFISVRDTFLLTAVGSLLHMYYCYSVGMLWLGITEMGLLLRVLLISIYSFVVGTNFMVASTEFIFHDLAYMDWSMIMDLDHFGRHRNSPASSSIHGQGPAPRVFKLSAATALLRVRAHTHTPTQSIVV
ncbi:plasma membrane calcium [Mortierella antarctica]|nr:plasma membrane calcium [Mortierella antarctica]